MSETKIERRALEPETPGDVAAEEARALDAQSSTSEAYALVVQNVKQALAIVSDTSQPIAQRAHVYAGLRLLRLQIDRAIREPGRELQALLAQLAAEQGDHVQYGPLRLKWSAVDVEWPVNAPGNWEDEGVQQLLAEWEAAINVATDSAGLDPIIVDVPHHREVDTRALGAAVHAGLPAARALHRELTERRLRTESHRRASIELVE